MNDGECMLSFPQRAGNLLRRSKSRPLSPLERYSALHPGVFSLPPFTGVPNLETGIVSPTSPEYEEARALQAERFARASMPGASAYLGTVDFAPERTIGLLVRRQDTKELVGTACLELPSVKSIATSVQFTPDSSAAEVAARGTFAEIRGFAARFDLEWWQILNLIDALAGGVVQIAEQLGIEWFWVQPRFSAMSVFLAEIPGLLPPYRFVHCLDVAGWHEESEAFAELRALRLKELPLSAESLPIIYQITPKALEEDLKNRLALLDKRQRAQEFRFLLPAAMRQAHRKVRAELALSTQSSQREDSMLKRKGGNPSTATDTPAGGAPEPPTTDSLARVTRPSFLYSGATASAEEDYLGQFMAWGGVAAQRYKTLSYDLLRLAPGMQVLDVGCGLGGDLPSLAERVGEDGLVVGVDYDHQRVQVAQKTNSGRSNVRVVLSAAEHLPFAHRSFDAVRADRLLQHVPEPMEALTEMWRVLRPGGVVTLIEPDWQSVALSRPAWKGEMTTIPYMRSLSRPVSIRLWGAVSTACCINQAAYGTTSRCEPRSLLSLPGLMLMLFWPFLRRHIRWQKQSRNWPMMFMPGCKQWKLPRSVESFLPVCRCFLPQPIKRCPAARTVYFFTSFSRRNAP